MVTTATPKTCAYCGWRDAIMKSDGKPACGSCVPDAEPVEKPATRKVQLIDSDTTKGRILRALRGGSATYLEMRERLGIPGVATSPEDKRVFDCYQAALKRLVSEGRVLRERDGLTNRYTLVPE